MPEITRRHYLGGALATAAAAGLSCSAPPAPKPAAKRQGTIRLAEVFSAQDKTRLKLAKQIGINHAILIALPSLAKVRKEQYAETLGKIKADFDSMGVTIAGVESHPVPAEKIKLGVTGRDEEIENYKWVIHALAKTGIPMICWNFMAGIGWFRTRVDIPERGGALSSEFDLAAAEAKGPTEWGTITEEKLWDNMTYFLKAVIPEAEKAGIKMAAHPDDPPLPKLRGISRILTTARNYRRVMDIVPSPVNGVTFCQANFKLMGENIEELAREWCSKDKIFFVHFRDVEGTKEKFHETFHDNGPTDMARMLEIYAENGFDGPVRPDHAPTLEGESNDNPGYAMAGKILAIGYMKGLMKARGIRYD
jgi:mannonate dehydratase